MAVPKKFKFKTTKIIKKKSSSFYIKSYKNFYTLFWIRKHYINDNLN